MSEVRAEPVPVPPESVGAREARNRGDRVREVPRDGRIRRVPGAHRGLHEPDARSGQRNAQRAVDPRPAARRAGR